jgi:hypothetical protein
MLFLRLLHITDREPSSKKRKDRDPMSVQQSLANDDKFMHRLLVMPFEVPVTAQGLRVFLSNRTEKLPVLSPETFDLIKEPDLMWIPKSGSLLHLAAKIETALLLSTGTADSKADSSHILRFITRDFLSILNRLAPTGLQLCGLEATFDPNSIPSSRSTVSTLQRLKRPNYSLYVRKVLILRWENKIHDDNFTLAREENTSKLKVWSNLYYGDLPYVIGGCCGGRRF